jgi:DNA repair protein RecO
MERGFLLELMVYIRPNRDLHTLGGVQGLEFFPATRTSLIRTAVRDSAFETALSAISLADPHPELFEFFLRFLRYLETAHESSCYPYALWRFFFRFAGLLGFAADPEYCARCREALDEGAFLEIGTGSFLCPRCGQGCTPRALVPPGALSVLNGARPSAARSVAAEHHHRITRLLADYCRYHFEAREEYRSLRFLEQMTGT